MPVGEVDENKQKVTDLNFILKKLIKYRDQYNPLSDYLEDGIDSIKRELNALIGK